MRASVYISAFTTDASIRVKTVAECRNKFQYYLFRAMLIYLGMVTLTKS